MHIPELKTAAEKRSRTVSKTVILDFEDCEASWKVVGDIQRGSSLTKKIVEVGEDIGGSGIFPSTIYIAVWEGNQYINDGLQRFSGWRDAVSKGGPTQVAANVQWEYFPDGPDGKAKMGERFAKLQLTLKRHRPDDGLRAIQHSLPAIKLIADECPNVGFGAVQRSNSKNTSLSMAVALQSWASSASEQCTSSGSARDLAYRLTMDDAKKCVSFLTVARGAWGSTVEYNRLWGPVNLSVCMWLYRRMVVDPEQGVTPLTAKQFSNCLVTLTNDTPKSTYVEWLRAKPSSAENRRMALANHIRPRFISRIRQEKIRKHSSPKLPDLVVP